MTQPLTPGQTIGPFFHDALVFDLDRELVPADDPGAVRLHGHVYDGAGQPVPDALVEVRQADPTGRVPDLPGALHRDGRVFTGWGRSSTDAAGSYAFTTVVPGQTSPDRPAFIAVTVFARGLLDALFTRAYLPAPAEVLAADPLLAVLGPQERAGLVMRRLPDDSLRFDIHLQGGYETVFLDFPRRCR